MKNPERRMRTIEVLIETFCVQGCFKISMKENAVDVKSPQRQNVRPSCSGQTPL